MTKLNPVLIAALKEVNRIHDARGLSTVSFSNAEDLNEQIGADEASDPDIKVVNENKIILGRGGDGLNEWPIHEITLVGVMFGGDGIDADGNNISYGLNDLGEEDHFDPSDVQKAFWVVTTGASWACPKEKSRQIFAANGFMLFCLLAIHGGEG